MVRGLFILVISVAFASCAVPSRYTAFMTDWVSMLDPGEAREARSVDACDLPVDDGELIRVQAVYTGFQEYWGLYPVEPCDGAPSGPSVEFNTHELFVRFENRKAMRQLRGIANDQQLIVDVIGTFDSSSEYGYGHLGTSYAEIDAKAFRIVEVRQPARAPSAD